VCNGIKKNGRQNLLCRSCGKQFQAQYVYKGSIVANQAIVLKMLCRGSGIRDCAAVSGVSKVTVLRWIKGLALGMIVKPAKRHYHQVQIDEQWSYVGRKEKKVWMIYAYAAQEDEILAFTMGKRSAEAVQSLFVKLKALEIDYFLTDDWEAFRAVLPKTKHRIGKRYTKAIEGINTFFRTRLRRLMRRTVCFSKKLVYHYSMIKIIICYRNLNLSYI
jgi:IS1 family transposase